MLRSDLLTFTRHRTSLGLRDGGFPLDGLIEKLAITGDQEGAQCEVRRGGAASTGLAEAGRQVASLHPAAAGTPVRAGPAAVAYQSRWEVFATGSRKEGQTMSSQPGSKQSTAGASKLLQRTSVRPNAG